MMTGKFQSLKELFSTGKSGSFFYYTSDGKFMLKTIRKEEFKLMQKMLKDYYEHVSEKNTDSLICRIFGLHKIIFEKQNQHSKK